MSLETSIRERAYFLWEQQGKPEGQDIALWHQAKAEIEREQAEATVLAATPLNTTPSAAASDVNLAAPSAPEVAVTNPAPVSSDEAVASAPVAAKPTRKAAAKKPAARKPEAAAVDPAPALAVGMSTQASVAPKTPTRRASTKRAKPTE